MHHDSAPGAADTPLQFRPLGRRLPDVALWAFAYRGLDGLINSLIVSAVVTLSPTEKVPAVSATILSNSLSS